MIQDKSFKELTVKQMLFHFNDIFSSIWTTFTRKLLQVTKFSSQSPGYESSILLLSDHFSPLNSVYRKNLSNNVESIVSSSKFSQWECYIEYSYPIYLQRKMKKYHYKLQQFSIKMPVFRLVCTWWLGCRHCSKICFMPELSNMCKCMAICTDVSFCNIFLVKMPEIQN